MYACTRGAGDKRDKFPERLGKVARARDESREVGANSGLMIAREKASAELSWPVVEAFRSIGIAVVYPL